MSNSKLFFVGRHAEVDHFNLLANGHTPYPFLNIYGPGGIGKTVVGEKLKSFATTNQIPLAFIDGNRQDLTPQQILYEIAKGLTINEMCEDAFAPFIHQHGDYLLIQDVLKSGGGLQTMFNVMGMPQNPEGLSHILSGLKVSMTQEVEQIVRNRFTLERYLRNVESSLTDALIQGLTTATSALKLNFVILFDTYEQMEGYDDWICRQLCPRLPDHTKVVILGRNALPRINFDWSELDHALHTMELPELAESEAKAYLQHYGLHDLVALDQIYRFTGGYPLLLVLVVHLAREAGGWQQVGRLEYKADRDRVATFLLERILWEERVQEVRAFLEKGVVSRWFTPEIVSVILEVSPDEGQTIYDKLYRHSFIERHPYGLKFHDKIRDLLLTRLKFRDAAEHMRIVSRLQSYYANKAGIAEDTDDMVVVSNPNTASSPPTKQSFGQLLRYFRRESTDPVRGGLLTQKRLADLLYDEGFVIVDVTISHWENDRIPISHTDRLLLLALIRILHHHHGIRDRSDADMFLFAGGYRQLDENELLQSGLT